MVRTVLLIFIQSLEISHKKKELDYIKILSIKP